MISFIYGGSGSGKSAFAEERVVNIGKSSKYYLATMQVYGKEGLEKVRRHQRLREGKGFQTVECPRNIKDAVSDKNGTVLLECMSNLVANEMFEADTIHDEDTVVKKVLEDLWVLCEKIENIVIVSNNIFEDGINYDASTVSYMNALGRINAAIAGRADEVYEVVVGIPVKQKG